MRKISKKEFEKKLGKFVKVENAYSKLYGRVVNNYVLTYEGGEVFQHYSDFVAAKIDGEYYFTSKHLGNNIQSSQLKYWCGYTAAERRKGLENGKFIFVED